MIGTHNSMTAYKAKNKIFEWLNIFWRCQEKTIQEQIADGVKYFDIRIRLDRKGRLHFCHGLVDLKTPYNIGRLMNLFKENSCKCRIVIERGNVQHALDYFKFTDSSLWHGVVEQIIIKKGWHVWYRADEISVLYDYSYVPIRSDKNIFDEIRYCEEWTTIRKYAAKNNPRGTWIEPRIVRFMDFYNIRENED